MGTCMDTQAAHGGLWALGSGLWIHNARSWTPCSGLWDAWPRLPPASPLGRQQQQLWKSSKADVRIYRIATRHYPSVSSTSAGLAPALATTAPTSLGARQRCAAPARGNRHRSRFPRTGVGFLSEPMIGHLCHPFPLDLLPEKTHVDHVTVSGCVHDGANGRCH